MAEEKKAKPALKAIDLRRLKRKRLKRKSERKQAHNQSRRDGLSRLRRELRKLIAAGKKTEAAETTRKLSSALDKAAKTGLLHHKTADRRKSRMAKQLAKVAA
ncbi:MAG: 30S ribosomal protein S20 [Pedosphaera sp.]|nr:30S ribosomal protein S20 [Pedosphaera sp.]